MNIAEWLVRTAAPTPSGPALLVGETVEADYRGFACRAASVGAVLTDEYAIRPGDRVAILATNSVDYLAAFYGIWFAGAAVVPINAKLHPKEAAWIMENSEASVVFASPALGEAVAAHVSSRIRAVVEFGGKAWRRMLAADPLSRPVPRGRDDLAWLFYTSGTTGKPKGVMITNGNIHAMAFTYFTDVDVVDPTDAALYAAPLSHGAGLYNDQHVLKGARHVVPESGGFEPEEIFSNARALERVHMFAAPTMVRRLVDHARTAGSTGDGIRTIVYGGGPMYLADIVEAVDVMGPRFCQIYGQGESPMAITALPRCLVADRADPRWRERLASVGRAQSCVELRVADSEGRPLPIGEPGEVLVRGAPVMAGYWRNEEASAATLRDGWLWTGDVGVVDAEGFLTLKDRSKDVIISGGANIYPREVEEALLSHPAVREASVVGRADEEWGETVVA
ncbi:MAG: AMP-binding protein, partial [Rhizobiaceae bacterium]